MTLLCARCAPPPACRTRLAGTGDASLHQTARQSDFLRRARSTPAPAHQVKPSAPGSVKLSTGVKPEQARRCLSWSYFTFLNTWIFCAASSAGKSANASKPPFRRSTSFRTDQKPGTTLCQPQRVACIDSSPLVWTTGRPTAKGGKGLCRVKKVTPTASGSIALGRSL